MNKHATDQPTATVLIFAVCLVAISVFQFIKAFKAYGEGRLDDVLEHAGIAALLLALGLRSFFRDERQQDQVLNMAALPLIVIFGIKAYRQEWLTAFVGGFAGIFLLCFLLKRLRSRTAEK